MEETKKKLKVYCETSFWSYLVGGSTADEKIARWRGGRGIAFAIYNHN